MAIGRTHYLWIVPLLAMAGAAFAQSDPIGERRALMRKMARAEHAATSVILGKYLPDKAAAALDTIQELMPGFSAYFPAGSEAGGESKASSTIWTERQAFEALAEKIVADARDARSAVAAGQDAFAVAWQKVSEDCTSCHTRFAPAMIGR